MTDKAPEVIVKAEASTTTATASTTQLSPAVSVATSVTEAVAYSTDDMPPPPLVETFMEKTQRKFSQEPLVPIGALLTCGFLV